MQIVPLQPLANQTVSVSLANQSCTINVRQTLYGMFMTLETNNAVVIAGVIAQNLNRIVRNRYLGFDGDFTFLDTQGTNDPNYTGIGTRYFLAYLEEPDIASLPS